MGFWGESEMEFSESEFEVAEQLVQMRDQTEDTLSCSSVTGRRVCSCGYGHTKRQEDVVKTLVGKEQNDEVKRNKKVNGGRSSLKVKMETKKNKKEKSRSLESIYKATREIIKID